MEMRERDRRDRLILWLVTTGSGLIIAIVLYFAGAFTRSTS